MKNVLGWIAVMGTVAIASLSDSVAAVWAKGENKFSIYLLLIFLLSPFVFISFGLVTSRIGLAITSGVINSLLVLSTILVGLFFFNEWNKVSFLQYLGMFFALVGIVLMLFSQKA